MESQEVLVNGGMSNGSAIISYGNGLEQVNSDNGLEQVGFDEKGKGNLAEEVLEDLEEYWEDINDRLMISRMVSDSVIKGMVTAVEQEAAEKIASKELELSNLKWFLQSHEVVTGKFEDVRLPVGRKTFEAGNYGRFSCVTNAFVKHEKMREDLHALRSVAGEQFKKAKKEIECARGANSIKKIGSGSELVGLGGILEEKQCESWMHVDKTLECLKTTVDTICTKVDDILLSSRISLSEWQQDQVLSAKLEDIVIQSVLRSLQEELEENLWEQYVQFTGTQDVNWLEKLNDISSLGNQLDAVLKSLSLPETGFVSHGSHDLENLHHKTLSNHIQSPSLCGENGTLDASDIHVAESYDFQQLRHMPKEELVNYFNNIISKMKRDHESALQQKTEEYFRLKREYLKEKRSFVTHRKDEEFDALRKRIPDIISKLENFLLENKKFPTLTNNVESMGKLKHRLDNLLSENHHLRDSLADKKNEVKCLEAEILDAAAKLSEHTLAEENMLKLVENLKSAMEDSCIEASLSEEVYKCALREQLAQRCCVSEDSNMSSLLTEEIYDIILREAVNTAENANRHKVEDSDIESLIVQDLSGLILTEAVKDAGRKLNDLSQEVLIDKEIRISLAMEALEKENELRLLVEEKEKLRQEILDMRTAIKQKEKLAMGLSISLSKEREQFELALRELGILREHSSRQETLVAESNRELETLRSQHAEALKQIEVDRMEIQNLNQKLDQTKEVLTEANKERHSAFTLSQETHDKLLVSEAREEKLRKEMEMAASGFSKMFDDFACRVSGVVKSNTLRLEDISSQLKAFSKMATVLRSTGFMYKQKLERRCADLQMAEAEVDLLGDEVDALLRLLEKIYIALDHYSPVLKHYPGIIEILELVRRELSGGSTKLL
ncbi:WPP domain-associated protein [Sesamum indicum]|uniref:WPP domain-associated protein n=1 Tax=Sesamum indicum TaxID=4182 RepID=A0A6I9TP89_SESIN|nr:WPP domain-associated protein [Sesamum indicum]